MFKKLITLTILFVLSIGFVQAAEKGQQKIEMGDLEMLVQPIAMYQDDLLGHVLIAATHPDQVIVASEYLKQHGGKVTKMPDKDWDPSVKALLFIPSALNLLSDDLNWTRELGYAVTSQKSDLMNAIQNIRKQQVNKGNLKSTDKQKVAVEDDKVLISSNKKNVVYVPQYSNSTSSELSTILPAILSFTVGDWWYNNRMDWRNSNIYWRPYTVRDYGYAPDSYYYRSYSPYYDPYYDYYYTPWAPQSRYNYYDGYTPQYRYYNHYNYYNYYDCPSYRTSNRARVQQLPTRPRPTISVHDIYNIYRQNIPAQSSVRVIDSGNRAVPSRYNNSRYYRYNQYNSPVPPGRIVRTSYSNRDNNPNRAEYYLPSGSPNGAIRVDSNPTGVNRYVRPDYNGNCNRDYNRSYNRNYNRGYNRNYNGNYNSTRTIDSGNRQYTQPRSFPTVNRSVESRSRVINSGSRSINSGSSVINSGSRSINSGSRVINSGSRSINSGSRVINSGNR